MSDENISTPKRKRKTNVTQFAAARPRKTLSSEQLNDALTALARFDSNPVLALAEFKMMHQETAMSLDLMIRLCAEYDSVIKNKKDELTSSNPLLNESFFFHLLWLLYKAATEVRPRQTRKNQAANAPAVTTSDVKTQLEVLKMIQQMRESGSLPAANKDADNSNANRNSQAGSSISKLRSGVSFGALP
jgi:hypothetical protein